MINRLLVVLLGVSLIVCGYSVTTKRSFYSSQYLQWVDWGPYHFYLGALIAIVGFGFIFSSTRKTLDREEAARLLQSFVDISGRQKEWKRFLHTTTNDSLITDIQRQCMALPDKYPPDEPGTYTNREGKIMLRQFIEQLKRIE